MTRCHNFHCKKTAAAADRIQNEEMKCNIMRGTGNVLHSSESNIILKPTVLFQFHIFNRVTRKILPYFSKTKC